MRPAPRVLLGLALTASAVLGPAVPALAAGSGTTTVKPTAEGWYRSTPTCTLPTGCADLTGAPSPYPAGTLHVGVSAGAEEARTYLRLDLAALPAGTKPSGGTLLLPVASADDGTRAAETATLRACAVTGEVEDVDGSFAAPPEVDCESASAPATFVPAEGEDPAAFTVDLAPLTAAWLLSGVQPGALALLPAEDLEPTESWHVAFSDRTRTGEDVVPISAAVAFVSASLDTDDEPAPVVAPPPFEPAPPPAPFDSSSEGLDFSAGTSFAAPPLSADAPLPEPAAQAAPAPQSAPVQQVVPVAATIVSSGFRYPGVFLLPLALAVAVGWLGRAMTRDLATPKP